MAGSLNLFDAVDYTSDSEYDPRTRKVNTLQIHHATMLSLSGLIGMMDPGGRQVSANGALGNDGRLVEVVPLNQRAYTSATAYDNQCLTVETCNTSLSPTWGISVASRERLAQLAVGMFRAGLLGGLTRQFIIGHYEVPGTYATACPGPDMNLDWIVARAKQIYAAGGSGTAGSGGTVPIKEKDMDIIKRATNGVIEFRDQDGVENIAAYGAGLNATQLNLAANGLGMVTVPDAEFDLSRQVAGRRNTALADARKKELVEVLAPLVAAAVAKALEGVEIPAPDVPTAQEIAVAVLDEDHRRSAS